MRATGQSATGRPLVPGCLRLARAALAAIAVLCLAACGGATIDRASLQTGSAGAAAKDGLRLVSALPPPSDTNNGASQPIAQGDVLQVEVFQVPDLSRTVTVDSGGMINLPLIGNVPAAGRTLGALQGDVRSRYAARYLQSPDITVSMKDSAGQKVTVSGQVNKAGLYPTAANTTLIQAIAEASGLTSIADANKVFVFRTVGGHRLVAHYSIARISAGDAPDPRIYGGDVVVVFSSGTLVAMQNLRQALGLASSAVTLSGI